MLWGGSYLHHSFRVTSPVLRTPLLPLAAVFFQIGTNQSSLAKRLPVLFFCTINQVSVHTFCVGAGSRHCRHRSRQRHWYASVQAPVHAAHC